MYFDKNGVEISMQEYANLSALEGYRVVKKTHFSDGSFVSTVWLGINHAHFSALPIVFETMAFDVDDSGKVDWGGEEMRRYGTEQEALAGHDEVVEAVLARKPSRKIDLS